MALPSQTVLAAIGSVAVRHGQLDYSLKMAVRSLKGLSIEAGIADTQGQMTRGLTDRIRRLAKCRFSDSQVLDELEMLLSRAGEAATRRNRLLHSLWARDMTGEFLNRDMGVAFNPIPNASDLRILADDLIRIANDIHSARLQGFLKAALDETSPV